MRLTCYILVVEHETDEQVLVIVKPTTHLPTNSDSEKDSDSENEADLSGGDESDDDDGQVSKSSLDKEDRISLKKKHEKSKNSRYWMRSIIDKHNLKPVRVCGRFPSYSRFVHYDLEASLINPNSLIYQLNHIHNVYAPVSLSIRRIRYVVAEALDRKQNAPGHDFMSHAERKRLNAFWSARDKKKKQFVELKGRNIFRSVEDLQAIASNDLQKMFIEFRLLDNLFVCKWYYVLFPYVQRRELARPDDIGAALQRLYTAIVRNPLKSFLSIWLDPQDSLFQRISETAFRSLSLLSAIHPAAFAARLWSDEANQKLHKFGQTRFPLPNSVEVLTLLLASEVIELDRFTPKQCRLTCAADAIRAIVRRLKECGDNIKILAVTESALGDTELDVFISGANMEDDMSSVFVVSATPYTRRELISRGVTMAEIFDLSTIIRQEKQRQTEFSKWRNRHYSKLLLHNAEQMGLYEVQQLLCHDKQKFKNILIMADLRRMPPTPVSAMNSGPITSSSGSEGLGNWMQDIMNLGDFAVAQTERDVDSLRQDMIRVNIDAVIEQKLVKMRISRSLAPRPDEKKISNNPGVFLLSREQFLGLARAGALPTGFDRQILVEDKLDRDTAMNALYPEYERKKIFVGQLVRTPGNIKTWRIDNLVKMHGTTLKPVNSIDRVSHEIYAGWTLEIPFVKVEKYKFVFEDRLRAVDCDFLGACPRLGVNTVFYLVHPFISSAKSLYTVLSMAKTQCVFVGALADIQAAISRSDPFITRLRVTFSPEPLKSSIAAAAPDPFEDSKADEQPLPNPYAEEVKNDDNEPRGSILEPIGRPPVEKKKRKRKGEDDSEMEDDSDNEIEEESDEEEEEEEDEEKKEKAVPEVNGKDEKNEFVPNKRARFAEDDGKRRRSDRKSPDVVREALYLKPIKTSSGYQWPDLEVVDIPNKGKGVRAKNLLVKGRLLQIWGKEIPAIPYPENTTYIIESGKIGTLINMLPDDAPESDKGLFIVARINEPSKDEKVNMTTCFDEFKQFAMYKVLYDIQPGQELLVDYGDKYDRSYETDAQNKKKQRGSSPQAMDSSE